MQIQQIIALLVILFFIIRIFYQKKNDNINNSEFRFWLIFWILSGAAIVFLPKIDAFVFSLGFSASGIQFLLYLSIAVLFYFIFRLRLRLAKIERDITKIVKETAIKNIENNK